jgi:hypothetical protein
MSTEIEINTGKEEEPTPEEKATKEAEKKQKLDVLYGTLKKLMTGEIKAQPVEIEMMKKQTIEAIADCYEEEY